MGWPDAVIDSPLIFGRLTPISQYQQLTAGPLAVSAVAAARSPSVTGSPPGFREREVLSWFGED
ncbi:hypothetical protein AKJ16_DCAP07287 [Drosera capensis]